MAVCERPSYGNNQYVYFTYDDLDRLTEKKYSDTEKFTYSYDANGALAVQTDSVNATTTRYTYDMAGRIVNAREQQSDGTLRGQMYYRYENGKNRLSYYTFTVPKNGSSTELRDNTTLFTYGNLSQGQMPDAVYGVTAGVQRLAYTYDGLGRLSTRTLSVPQRTTSYTYVPGAAANQTSALLQSINNAGEVLSYTYDANGNITEIKKGGVLQESYVYDSLNQLVRENSVPQNRTFTYTYDAGGNLQQKKEYAYTTGEVGTALDTIVYTYGSSTWKDILTGYDGQYFTKDNLANPLTYRDGMSFTWQHGRQLATATVNGVTASYLYNDNGIRTQKTVGGVTTKYYLSGDQLHGELRNGKDIIYRYDANGQCYGFQYDGSFFYFEFNGQGRRLRAPPVADEASKKERQEQGAF